MVPRVRYYNVSQAVNGEVCGTEEFSWPVANYPDRTGIHVFTCQHLGERGGLSGSILVDIVLEPGGERGVEWVYLGGHCTGTWGREGG